jgi:hypothetical protein
LKYSTEIQLICRIAEEKKTENRDWGLSREDLTCFAEGELQE